MDKIDKIFRKGNPKIWEILDFYNDFEDFAYWAFIIEKLFNVKQVAFDMGYSQSWLYKHLEAEETGKRFNAKHINLLIRATQFRHFGNFILKGTPFQITRVRTPEEIMNNFIQSYDKETTIYF